ncbi:MAG: Coenzyme F420 hydrogenase/dehydrogenase, beta subunit C-terminal domain, partial [Candidatus Bathyarchaeota archaeon]
QVTNPMGTFQKIFVGYAKDKKIRENASSGGVITQLLAYLVEAKEIDGAIVTSSDSIKLWKAKPFLALSKEDILDATQSKYVISPVNQILKQVRRTKGKFAFVGLPCHVHSLRKLFEIDRKLSEKIPLIIGLYCHMTLETDAPFDMLEVLKIPSFDIQKLEFRSGKWPGGIAVKMKDGSFKKMHEGNIKDAFNILHRLYYPRRCLYCIDGSNELADISIADPWLLNKKGKYPFEHGFSLVVVRTDVGKKYLNMAKINGALFLQEIDLDSFLDLNLLMMKKKRKMAFVRIEKLRKKKKPFPEYSTATRITMIDQFFEILSSIEFFFGKSKFTRKIALRILLSPLGSLFRKISNIMKPRRF